MLFRTRMFLNLFAWETRGENTAIFVTSLGRMKNLSFCRNSILWYQRMLVGYSELWATVKLRVNDRVNYAIYLSRSSPTLLSPDSLGKFHYGEFSLWCNWIQRLSFGSKHCTWPIRNALTAPRKYWGLEIAQGIYSYTAVSGNVRQSWKVLWMVLIFTVLQRNLKKWHKRSRTYVREC